MHKTIKLGRGSTNSAKKFWLSDSSAYSIQSFVSSRRSFVSRRPQNINFGPGIFIWNLCYGYWCILLTGWSTDHQNNQEFICMKNALNFSGFIYILFFSSAKLSKMTWPSRASFANRGISIFQWIHILRPKNLRSIKLAGFQRLGPDEIII